MATEFPAGSDNFTEPSSPGTTALSSSGTGSRNHVQHHRDLGDAIEAMQVEATLLVHSHDGSTARHGSKLSQANTHQSADTDSGPTAIHHTLGHGVDQAAPGNHAGLPEFSDTHDATVAWPVGSIFMTTVSGDPSGAPHNLGGTWVQIQDAFLVGVGGSYEFTGSVVSNSTTHTHAVADTGSAGGHSHTSSSATSTSSSHSHTAGSTGTTSPTHTHPASGSGTGTHTGTTSGVDIAGMLATHTHTLGTNTGSDVSHSHTGGTPSTVSGHSHTLSGSTSAQADHSHGVSASTDSHLPPWLAVYTWKRTA